MSRAIRLYETTADLAAGAAEIVVQRIAFDLSRGTAAVALSGGSSPRSLYELLASPAWRGRVDWSRVRFFPVEEACGGHTPTQSSYRLAEETLFKPLAVHSKQIHRIQTDKPPRTAADLYEAELHTAFGTRPGQIPEFSAVILGLGPDGHTAALYPHSAVLGEKSRLAVGVSAEHLPYSQVTLTLPMINNARTVIFLVSGKIKAAILQAVLEDDTPAYPAQLVQPVHGELYWCIDTAAACMLDITRYL